MSIKTRTAAVITSALAATTIAGVAAFASPATGPGAAGMGGPTMHMEQMDEATMAEMAALMAEDATVGEMHQWMADNGMPIGEMHRDMTRGGTNPGSMHRSMAAPSR
ncbi:MAG: hypothetical protein ACLGH4_00270 [Actinomycetes bacterium]